MTLDSDVQRRLIKEVADRVIVHAGELVALDQAIGDGDHGLNMQRGFATVLAELDRYCTLPLGEALRGVGVALVRSVGGASGPLYGTLFMELGKSLPPDASREGVARAFGAAVDAVKARGKSDVGQKTMLDVLVPVLQALRESDADLPARLRAAARAAAAATVPMRATRGRASFLGERSIGHMDPGARSSELMVQAVADVLESTA
jgi:dihydroxyacetone kinase-like protein